MRSEQGWAVVTGASSGLGAAFAEALARRGSNLVLVARREPPMLELAARLEAEHGVNVAVEAMDLGAPGSAAMLQDHLDGRGIDAGILVNNAAFGLSGPFLDNEPERLRAMLQLDVVALTELTHTFARRMAARGQGRILLVASLAAFQPDPLLAAYGAAKAYVLSLGEALNVELAPHVGVTVLSPGLMDTEFNDVSGYQTKPSMRRTVLPVAQVAAIGLDAMFAGRSSVVAGRVNKVMAFGSRFLSRRFQARTVYRLSKA